MVGKQLLPINLPGIIAGADQRPPPPTTHTLYGVAQTGLRSNPQEIVPGSQGGVAVLKEEVHLKGLSIKVSLETQEGEGKTLGEVTGR